jgi:hypothetical protein
MNGSPVNKESMCSIVTAVYSKQLITNMLGTQGRQVVAIVQCTLY